MKYIDLHTHSNFSDGTDSPADIVAHAIQKGLAAFALTDHDTVSGIAAAMTALKEIDTALEFIPGTELSVGYKSGDIHIVGLYIDYKNDKLSRTADLVIKRRDDRNHEMVDRLRKDGIPITYEALTLGNHDTVVTRAHFARWLVDNKIVSTPGDAFKKYLNTNTKYYVPRKYITPEEGIEIILGARGIPILAHPLHYKLPEQELVSLISRLKDAGLMGIEVKYSNHTKQDEIFASRLARKFELLPSGGSDYHGDNKPAIDLGTGRGKLKIPYTYLENIKAARH